MKMRHDRGLEEPPEHPDDCGCRECRPKYDNRTYDPNTGQQELNPEEIADLEAEAEKTKPVVLVWLPKTGRPQAWGPFVETADAAAWAIDNLPAAETGRGRWYTLHMEPST